VVDVIWRETGVRAQDVAERARVLNKLRIGDIAFHQITKAAALFVLVVLGGVIVSLFLGAMPAFQEFGFSFITAQSWNPVTEKFGALAPIYGTIITSLIAMLIAVPLGLMIAMFLTELCPMWLRRPIGIAIELLAGIPSIIYGIWGLFVFAPFLQTHVQPAVIAAFENVPVLSTLFEGPPFARRVRRGSSGAQGSGIRARLDPMGGLALCCAAVHTYRRHRRSHAGPWPRTWRNDGRDVRHRQRAQDFEITACAGYDDIGDDCQ